MRTPWRVKPGQTRERTHRMPTRGGKGRSWWELSSDEAGRGPHAPQHNETLLNSWPSGDGISCKFTEDQPKEGGGGGELFIPEKTYKLSKNKQKRYLTCFSSEQF